MPIYNPISNSDLIAPGALNKYYTAEEKAAIQTQFSERTSYGVVTGLIVAQQTVADMTVKVSTGTIYMANGTRFTPSAVASIAVTAADATNPRIDIVYVSSLGAISYLAGTAAASPSAPAVPTGGMKLAEINVAANATTVVTANIVSKRKYMWTEDWIYPTLINGWANIGGSEIRFRKQFTGIVDIIGVISSGTTGTIAFTLPAGYRPLITSVKLITNSTSVTAYATISVGGDVTIYSSAISSIHFHTNFVT